MDIKNIEEQKKKAKKIIIFTRHGERADRRDRKNCENIYDTNLTIKGFGESIITGKNLMKKFEILGLIPYLSKLRIVVSPFYRCIQTAKYLRQGLAEALMKAGFKHQSDFIANSPFYLEDAFSERISSRPIEHYDQLFIRKEEHFLEKRFPEIKFIRNSLFDYDKQNGLLRGERQFESKWELFDCCFTAYRDLFKKVLEEDGDSFYISVSHGMYIELLSMFSDDKKTFRKVHYNATSMLHLNDYKEWKDPQTGSPKWATDSIYFLRGNKMAQEPMDIFKLSNIKKNE